MIFVYTPTEFNFEKEFSQDVKSVYNALARDNPGFTN
jgi:hypothetical protein